jgi:hypothetical protein
VSEGPEVIDFVTLISVNAGIFRNLSKMSRIRIRAILASMRRQKAALEHRPRRGIAMIWKYVREPKPAGKENRRRHRRHRVQRTRAQIDRANAQVIDISESGVRIAGAPGWVVPGQGLSLRLIFSTLWRDVQIPVQGRVLRRGDTGTIVVYPPPIDEWPQSLAKLVRASTPMMH